MPAAKRLFSDVLTLADIACVRGGRVLFQNLSAHIAPAEVLRLSGENGAGKSSLLRIAAGALMPSAGAVQWNDESISETDGMTHGARFSFLPADDRDLKLLETAGENLLFWAHLWKIRKPEAAVAAALGAMGLLALSGTAVRYFSAGQKRRLSLARVVLKQAPLWLLDEPFNALDDTAIKLFSFALGDHLAAGGMVMMATHHHPDITGMKTLLIASGGRGAV